MTQTFDDLEDKIIILGGDINLFLDSVLEAESGSPVLKISSVLKIIEIKEKATYVTFGELEIINGST